ncbi:MAG: PTS sugar transporter subunit IIA [Alphaproteobacteria bacterium]
MDALFEDATIVAGLEANSKRRALQALAEQVAEAHGLDPRLVMDHLLEREQLGATGVGGGVAMPHGRIKGLERIAVGFARLATPVEYESPDGAPVDLVLLLLAPEEAGAICLKALSKASRILRAPAMRERLREAKDADAIRTLLTTSTEAVAA